MPRCSNGYAAKKSSWVPQLAAQESCNGLLDRWTSLGVSDPTSVQSSCMIIECVKFSWLDRRLNHDAILTIVNVVIQKSNLTLEFPRRAEGGFEVSARGLSIRYICFDTTPDAACSNTKLHIILASGESCLCTSFAKENQEFAQLYVGFQCKFICFFT